MIRRTFGRREVCAKVVSAAARKAAQAAIAHRIRTLPWRMRGILARPSETGNMKTVPFALAFTLAVASLPAAAQDRPNVVIVYADDLGYGDVSAYNPRGRLKTPNID